MARGGKRPGAGRPKGSTTRPQIRDFISDKEVKALVALAKSQAKDGKSDILKFLLEQIFGKPPQTLTLPDDADLESVVGFTLVRNHEGDNAGDTANS